MNADELLKVSEGLCWVTARLGDMPEEKQEALAAMAACTMANLVVVELAHHLAHGVEPYEALRRAAIGTLPVNESTTTMMKIFLAKPKE